MKILIGVSGGIAAYKALETARLAVKAGHSVRVIQTPTSQRFVGAASFAAITGAPVLTDEFEGDPARGSYPGEPMPAFAPISHLALVERADVFLIAPASANTIAKLAAGMADNLLSTAALAATCPLLVAPAMNNHMWENPATAANLATLGSRGVHVIAPGVGALASRGEYGVGRLPEPEALLARCEELMNSGAWSGLAVAVTAGGTQEPIDAVRFIGNRSSGRMGYALATRARARGAQVTVIAANVKLPEPAGATVLHVGTAAEMQEALESRFHTFDVLIMAAAVADFRPTNPADHKLKKTSAEAPSTIALEPTPDIVSGLAATKQPEQTIVGFAAEHGAGAVAYARDKLISKRLDAVVVNDIARADIGFDSGENEVTIVTADGEIAVPKASKATVADAILDTVSALRAGAPPLPDAAGLGHARQ